MGIFFAVINMIIRFYPKNEHWLSMAMLPLYVEFSVYLLVSLLVPGTFSLMPTGDMLIAFGGGAIGGMGLILMNYGFQKASMAQAAAFHYTQLLWGILYGWVFFGDVLDHWTAFGAALICGGCLWMLMQEKNKKVSIDA